MLFLTVLGAINWGLWGLFQYDLIASNFGGDLSFLSRVLFILVGIAGVYCISLFFHPEIYKSKGKSKRPCDCDKP
jgi:hypothetical protein